MVQLCLGYGGSKSRICAYVSSAVAVTPRRSRGDVTVTKEDTRRISYE